MGMLKKNCCKVTNIKTNDNIVVQKNNYYCKQNLTQHANKSYVCLVLFFKYLELQGCSRICSSCLLGVKKWQLDNTFTNYLWQEDKPQVPKKKKKILFCNLHNCLLELDDNYLHWVTQEQQMILNIKEKKFLEKNNF